MCITILHVYGNIRAMIYLSAVDLFVSFASDIIYEWGIDCIFASIIICDCSVCSIYVTSIIDNCCVMPTLLMSCHKKFLSTVKSMDNMTRDGKLQETCLKIIGSLKLLL
jgi:hypothetical protein